MSAKPMKWVNKWSKTALMSDVEKAVRTGSQFSDDEKEIKNDNIMDEEEANWIKTNSKKINNKAPGIKMHMCIEKNCNTEFTNSTNEIEFFKSKSMELPKRCSNCRIKRKNAKN
jgi:hypothetical protein